MALFGIAGWRVPVSEARPAPHGQPVSNGPLGVIGFQRSGRMLCGASPADLVLDMLAAPLATWTGLQMSPQGRALRTIAMTRRRLRCLRQVGARIA